MDIVHAAGRSELGEGSMWWPERQTLLAVDIMRGHLKLLPRGAAAAEVHDIGKPVSTVVLRAADCPRAEKFPLLVGSKGGFEEYDPVRRELRTLASPEAHLPGNRSNDGKCDPRGRFWLGTMGLRAEDGAGNLWCMDRDGAVTRRCVEHSFSICNGPAWSADGRHFYFVDTGPGGCDVHLLYLLFDLGVCVQLLQRPQFPAIFVEGERARLCVCVRAQMCVCVCGSGLIP